MMEVNDLRIVFEETDNTEYKSWVRSSQIVCRQITDHIVTRLAIIVLILIDMVFIIYIAAKYNQKNEVLDRLSLFISCIFLVEVLMRIYGLGPPTFFNNCINVVDLTVVLATFIWSLVSCIFELFTFTNVLPFVRLSMRLPRVFNILRIFSNKNNFLNSSRYVTSENKRRYRLDGFDLDLCYITNRVIAMSFPSSGLAALYRNPIMEVAKFLNERHGKRYKIYNLCEELGYDSKPFYGQLERLMIKDHNVPQLKDMLQFAKRSREWLIQDDRNVIVVHCKGGKGRTGTMICVHLINFGIFETAQLSLDYFGERRTDLSQGKKFQGVETPSQSRYVGYFEQVNKSQDLQVPEPVVLFIEKIVIFGIRDLGEGDGSDLLFSIHGYNISDNKEVTLSEMHLQSKKGCQSFLKKQDDGKESLHIEVTESPHLVNDIKIRFQSLNRKVHKGYDDCVFFFWFHTAFVDSKLLLTREQLDNPHKKSSWKVFKPDFAVEVFFQKV